MDQKIHRVPAVFQRAKAGLKAVVIGDIDIDQKITADRSGKGFHPLAKGVALIREGKFRAFIGQSLGNAPSDGAFIRHTHDKPALALH